MYVITKPFSTLVFLTLMVGLVGPGSAAPTSLKERSEYFSKVAAFANKTSVGLYCKKGELMSYYGTGVIISRDGYILTSTTVVPPGANDIKVYLNTHKIYDGTLVETSEAAESALIKILPDGLLPAASLASELPTLGERAYTLGNAHSMMRMGEQGSFSIGVISGLYTVESTDTQSSYSGLAIETDAAINPGQDGGMLLNSNGQLVGIVSLSYSTSRWQGVAVPITTIRESLPSLRENKVKISEKAMFQPLPGDSPRSLGVSGAARGVAKSLVLLDVKRTFPAEVMTRTGMDDFLASIPAESSDLRKEALMSAYSATDRLLATNQQVRRPAASVTGVLVSADGYILTSLFNVAPDEVWLNDGNVELPELDEDYRLDDAEASYVRSVNPVEDVWVTLPNGTRKKAEIIARHAPLGLALLKVDAKELPFIDLKAVSSRAVIGDACAVVGASKGPAGYNLNTGMVSADQRYRKRRFQFDAIINYGNSGGVILNPDGQILGLALAPMEPGPTMGRIWSSQDILRWQIAPNSGVSLAAKSSLIADALPAMIDGQSTLKMRGPFVGISPDNKHILGNQVRLAHVQPGSPADNAGLRVGDILVSFNARPIVSWKDLTDELDELSTGQTVKVEVTRPNRERYLILNGSKVSNSKDLRKTMDTWKDGDTITGKYVDKKDQTVIMDLTLGKRR